MKILQVNNHNYIHGGAEVVYFNTIDLLKKHGHNVITLSRERGSSLSDEQKGYTIPYSKSLKSRFYSYDARNLINKIIADEKPDLVHIHNIVGGITFSILPVLRTHHIPVVATLHDYKLLCPSCNFIDGKNQICEKCKVGRYHNCIINRCSSEGYLKSLLWASESFLRDHLVPFKQYINHYIFVSNFSQNKYLEFHPDIQSKSTRIYHFTNIFEQERSKGDYFLFFGRLTVEKGILTLLNAVKNLPSIKLQIVGDGPLKETIESNMTSNVVMLGYKTGNELKEIIRKSSFVVVAPECYETNSLSTMESNALGKPVIGSNIGALPELIENQKTGFIFTSKDSKSLSKIILDCSSMQKEQYMKLSDSAFQFASSKFSPDNHYNQLMDVYMKLVNK